MTPNEIWKRGVWIFLMLCFFGCCFANEASAEAVLVLSSGSPAWDHQIQTVLQAYGHTVTIGDQYFNFSGTGLAGQDVVLLLANFNWVDGDMPLAGQNALVHFVSNGGGLITGEWTVWKWGEAPGYRFLNCFAALSSIFPVQRTLNYGEGTSIRYTKATPDPFLNSDVPWSFSFQADYIEGTETVFEPLRTATVFYTTSGSANGAGLVGWRIGFGHVLQFSTVIGPSELADANYSRLVANAVSWAGHENLGPLVTEIRFDPETIRVDQSLTAIVSGRGLDENIYFDVRFRVPGSTENQVAFNWQQGRSARHSIPAGTIPGTWIVTGVRAHTDKDNHTGEFDPVPATLVVVP